MNKISVYIAKIKNGNLITIFQFSTFVMLLILTPFIVNITKERLSYLTLAREDNSNKELEYINVYVELDENQELKSISYANYDSSKLDEMVNLQSFSYDITLYLRKNNKAVFSLKPQQVIETTRYRDSLTGDDEIDEQNSGSEKVTIYKFKSPKLKDHELVINKGEKNLKSVSKDDYNLELNSLEKELSKVQSLNDITYLHHNTESRSNDNAFDIVIVGIGYESEKSEYTRLSEIMKEKILSDSYFGVNDYRVNIIRIDTPYSKSYFGGCYVACNSVVKLSNIVKEYKGDTAIVLVNNSARYSLGYRPTDSYIGVSWMSRPITTLEKLVVHEMGHSVGELTDEYVSISNPDNSSYNMSVPKTGNNKGDVRENCRRTCDFDDNHIDFNVCYRGCGVSTYLIRTTKTSMMKNWRDDFNKISKEALDIQLNKYSTPGNISPLCKLDINSDGVIDILDLSYISSRYGNKVEIGSKGDVKEDGVIDVFDLSLMSSKYGTEVPKSCIK